MKYVEREKYESAIATANSIGGILSEKIKNLEAQRDELLAALRTCREALLTVRHYRHPDLDSIANFIDDSIDMADKAIAKAVQP